MLTDLFNINNNFINWLTTTIVYFSVFSIICIPINLYNVFSIIEDLNNSCIKLDFHGKNALDYSKEAIEYIILNDKKHYYMMDNIIDTFWADECLGYCNNIEPCSCSFNLHSQIKSDILLKINLNNHNFPVKNINYIYRYNSIIDKAIFFEKQFEEFQKLKECDLNFYYKMFPNIFKKYNNFSNEHLISKYNEFN